MTTFLLKVTTTANKDLKVNDHTWQYMVVVIYYRFCWQFFVVWQNIRNVDGILKCDWTDTYADSKLPDKTSFARRYRSLHWIWKYILMYKIWFIFLMKLLQYIDESKAVPYQILIVYYIGYVKRLYDFTEGAGHF